MWAETIRASGQRFSDRPALVAEEGWAVSFAQFDRLTDEVAVGLARKGVRHSQLVALLVPSSVDYIVLYGALAKLGAITAGVSSRLPAPERTVLVNDVAGADRAIATAAMAEGMGLDIEIIEATLADGPGSVCADLRVKNETPPTLPPDNDRPVAVVFTSGTTGVPKGATFTDQILADIAVVDTGNGWGEGGPITSNTQMAHIGVMGKIPAQFAAGTTLHVIDKWSATTVLDAVARYRMPAVGGVAPQIALMLRHPDFDRYDFSSVKLVVTGGAPSPPNVIEEARQRFGADWTQRYACTEGGGIGTFTWIDAPMEEMLYTVGRPRPGIEVEVRDPDSDLAVTPGTVGRGVLPVTHRDGRVLAQSDCHRRGVAGRLAPHRGPGLDRRTRLPAPGGPPGRGLPPRRLRGIPSGSRESAGLAPQSGRRVRSAPARRVAG